MRVHHYMVEYEDIGGRIRFANDTDITSLTAAKTLASQVSTERPFGAYVVAFRETMNTPPQYEAVGHISFFDGKQSETDGVVI